jgi:hypothetical protein
MVDAEHEGGKVEQYVPQSGIFEEAPYCPVIY